MIKQVSSNKKRIGNIGNVQSHILDVWKSTLTRHSGHRRKRCRSRELAFLAYLSNCISLVEDSFS